MVCPRALGVGIDRPVGRRGGIALKRELAAEPDLEALAAWDTDDKAPAAILPPLVSATELYQGQIVALRPLFEDLLWDGLTMLIARPKAGKSWLTLQCAVHIAGGRQLDGVTAVDCGPVLYGAFEEPKARTMSRLRKLAPEGAWTDNLHFIYELLPLMGGGAEQLPERFQIGLKTASRQAGGQCAAIIGNGRLPVATSGQSFHGTPTGENVAPDSLRK